MLFVDKSGEGVRVEPDLPLLANLSPATIERARDVWMLALSDGGLDTRTIGRIFNVSGSTVSRRLRAIPPRAVAYFRRNRRAVGLPDFSKDGDSAGA